MIIFFSKIQVKGKRCSFKNQFHAVLNLFHPFKSITNLLMDDQLDLVFNLWNEMHNVDWKNKLCI